MRQADQLRGPARVSFARHDYIGTLSSTLNAYVSVVEGGARKAGVDVDAARQRAGAARQPRRAQLPVAADPDTVTGLTSSIRKSAVLPAVPVATVTAHEVLPAPQGDNGPR